LTFEQEEEKRKNLRSRLRSRDISEFSNKQYQANRQRDQAKIKEMKKPIYSVHHVRIVDFHVKKNEIGVICIGESFVIIEDGDVGDKKSLDIESNRLSVCGRSFNSFVAF
jgi:hypothetical protein